MAEPGGQNGEHNLIQKGPLKKGGIIFNFPISQAGFKNIFQEEDL